MADLPDLFQSLPIPQRGTERRAGFSGVLIPGSEHRLARDGNGRPAVLVSTPEDENRSSPLVLKNLRVEHSVKCRIDQLGQATIDGRFTLIQCQSHDEVLQQCFLELMASVLRNVGPEPSQAELTTAIDRIAALFHVLERPGTRSVQGLWGELFVIVHSRDPCPLVAAWHNQLCDRYDFASGAQRVDVKTTGERSRWHYLSLSQAYPPDGVQAVVASLMVESSSAGRCVGELWDAAREAVAHDPELRLKIDETCLAALGDMWQDARTTSFDEELALSSLAFYDVRDIPRVPQPMPDGVSDVRFRSNLALGSTIENAHRPTDPIVDWFYGHALEGEG